MASSTRHDWDGREDERVRRCGVDVDDESRSKELGRRGPGGALFALVAFRIQPPTQEQERTPLVPFVFHALMSRTYLAICKRTIKLRSQ